MSTPSYSLISIQKLLEVCLSSILGSGEGPLYFHFSFFFFFPYALIYFNLPDFSCVFPCFLIILAFRKKGVWFSFMGLELELILSSKTNNCTDQAVYVQNKISLSFTIFVDNQKLKDWGKSYPPIVLHNHIQVRFYRKLEDV